VYRSFDPVPPDWEQQIDRRVNFDPVGGQDVSLRAFLRVCSYGRADVEGHILERRSFGQVDIPVGAFEGELGPSLRAQGYHGAYLVTLGGPGAGSALAAGFWARVAMAENVGVWAMEITHAVTGYLDLYVYPNNLDIFDNMASNTGTHPSAFTKNVLGWLDDAAIVAHTGRIRSYDLHTLALAQPAPPGRVTAVRVGDTNDLRIESRQGLDQFDARIPAARQGVIVYQVDNPDTDPDPNRIGPKLLLRTPNGLTAGQSFVSAEGVSVQVRAALNGGYTVRVVDPRQHLLNRSAEFAKPPAAGVPSAAVVPGLGAHTITFRDTSGRLHELYRDTNGRTGTTDLTGNAGAPGTIGDPFPYVHQATNTVILLYRTGGSVVCSLYWSTGAVGFDNLSGSAGAPAAAGDPVGYYVPRDDSHHVIYRGGNGHLHELFWFGVAPVGYGGDLTAAAHAPNAVGTPSAYTDGAGNNIVVFRASDAHVRSLYWFGSGGVGHDDLSGVAGAPTAAGDPCAYYTAFNDTNQIAYVAGNGHVWELYWQGVNAVAAWDVSAAAGAPAATGNVSAYYNPSENTKHIIYRSADGRLHELWWFPGGTPGHGDLTTFAGAPLAASAPTGFVTTDPNTQHVVYRATDNQIYEIAW
jgi:hypothetical protein